jgi:D-glycero-D-manno-heptose 1,7-bisphosphate phosphatase
MQTSSSAIILDRDGTLHRDTGYLCRFEDFEPLPGVEEALSILRDEGFRLFVASNQSGVARGFFPLEDVLTLNAKIREYFREKDINLEEMVVCPHHPEGKVALYTGECDCRKPKPGMLLDLARRYGLDLARSYMVGDHPRDARAGIAAGATGVLINPNSGGLVDKNMRLKEFPSLLDFARSLKGEHASRAQE